MRIALITPGFSADEQDWCVPALHDLVRRLAARHDVQVFALRYPHRTARYRFHGTTVHAFGAAQRGRVRSARYLLAALRSLSREGRRQPFDVIHALWAGESGLIASLAARRLGVGCVISIMGSELERLDKKTRMRRVAIRRPLDRATAVTVGSKLLATTAARCGVDGVPMPLGIDTDRFTPSGECAELRGTPRLLMAASLIDVKNHAVLLEAMQRLVRRWPSLHLHLVGEGERRRRLEELAGSLGLVEHVTWHGQVDHAELPAYYRAVDLCVLASSHESQGMVVLEAAACGQLTVGTRVGILPEITPDAFLTEPGDAGGLSSVLELALEDREGRASAAAQACRRTRRDFTLENRIAALERLYEVCTAPIESDTVHRPGQVGPR